MGAQQYGIDNDRLKAYAQDIQKAVSRGIQVAIVIGGGNIFRGLSGASQGFDRVQGDQMGMLATVINSLALGSALTSLGVKNRVLTAIRMEPIGEFYSKRRAVDALEAGEVVILSGGTGNPFFTTDTGSSLRGIELEADVMLKGTRVDGIYTADQSETRQRQSLIGSPTMRFIVVDSRSWTLQRRRCAVRITYLSSSSIWILLVTC